MILVCAHCGKEFNSVRRSKQFCSRECANKRNGVVRSNAEDLREVKTVWSCGGGIQSTAIAVLICQGKLPKPDYAFMADCGFESARTIDYINRIIKPNLAAVGVDFQLVPSSNYVNVSLMDDRGYCNIPAFERKPDGKIIKYSTRCNGTWKQVVLRKWLHEQGVEKVIDWVGISTDEAQRSNKPTGRKWMSNAYPLIDLGLSRKDCVQLIKDAGWEMPIRTSCVMCPLRTKYEWLKLKMDCPEDFERACEYEKQIQLINPNIFLSNECRPLAEYVDSE